MTELYDFAMNKRLIFFLLPVIVMIFCSGCARLCIVERNTPQRCPDVMYFAGTQAGVAASLGILDTAGFILLPVVVPCELAADILFLPYDAARHLQYVSHPPLNEIIWKNDLNELDQRLAHGDDPNAVDFRFFGRKGQYPCRPLMSAFAKGRLEAFNMLLDHGADVPMEFFSEGNIYQMAFSPQGLDFLKSALKKGIAPDKLNSIYASTVVPGLLSRAKNWRIHEEEKFHIVHSLLSLLLDHGFTPNGIKAQHTALDYLLDVFPSEKRDRLVTLMRSFGAKTFAELEAEQPHALLPPEINPQDVQDCFKPVIEILLHEDQDRKRGSPYRFSASYPGIEGPLVVVDVLGMDGSQANFRKYINIHHRVTPTRWDIQGEPFDIPAYLRLILTPPGTCVPSRLPMDLPKKDVLLEEWYSLPTCELYIERLPYIFSSHRNTDIERKIGQILALAGISHDIIGKDDRYYFEHNPINRIGRLYYHHIQVIGNLNTIEGSYNLDLKDKKAEYLFEDKANALAKQSGLPGSWRAPSSTCFYSSHRDLLFLDRTIDHRVPYPDEIFAVVHTSTIPFLVTDSTRKNGQGNIVDYYWNCRIDGFPGKGNLVLYYGDEVSQETLDSVAEMTRKRMKW